MWTTLRCGTGSGNNGFNSGIALTKSDGSVTYMAMGPAIADNVYFYRPVTLNGPAALTVSNSTGAQQVVENAQAGQLCGWFFQQGGTTAWGLYESGSKYFVIHDYYSGGGDPLVIWSAAASSNAKQIWAEYPLIMHGADLVAGSATLATNAANGFFYFPTCAGAPTGTPSGHTGTVAAVYDTTDHQLWIYDGAWKAVTVS